jgi:hypothetical protein
VNHVICTPKLICLGLRGLVGLLISCKSQGLLDTQEGFTLACYGNVLVLGFIRETVPGIPRSSMASAEGARPRLCCSKFHNSAQCLRWKRYCVVELAVARNENRTVSMFFCSDVNAIHYACWCRFDGCSKTSECPLRAEKYSTVQ